MVFVDESERQRRDARESREPTAAEHSEEIARTHVDVPRRAQIQRPRLRKASASASSLGCAGCLVRLALFAVVVWYGGRWLLSIPEVRTLLTALRSGAFSDDQVNAAINAVRIHILQLVGASPAP